MSEINNVFFFRSGTFNCQVYEHVSIKIYCSVRVFIYFF